MILGYKYKAESAFIPTEKGPSPYLLLLGTSQYVAHGTWVLPSNH